MPNPGLNNPMTRKLRFETSSPEETQALGELIGSNAQPGDIYLLSGPLGAGKTCLSQGIARGLEVPENLRSPTFVLMTRHQGRLVLHHVDLYRINDPWEAWDLGLDEQLMGDGVCVVEWADKAAELFPAESCWMELDYGLGEGRRKLTVPAAPSQATDRYQPLIRRLKAAFPGSAESGCPIETEGGQ